MRIIKIAIEGDTGQIDKALRAAVEAVERVNQRPVYRSWIEVLSELDGRSGDAASGSGDVA